MIDTHGENKYDVIVIGGGHAGVEASLASARLGCKTLLCTMTEDTIGLMPCNPSIGGPAKGQIVGEIDALGGEMGRAADKTHIQLKILNRSRGPAVQCLRSQNDKHDYQRHMQSVVTQHPMITVLSEEVFGLLFEGLSVSGIRTLSNREIYAKAVVVTTGTFLKAVMHTGLTQSLGGRVNEKSSESLSDSLRTHFRLGRLKTGTPPRLTHDSIDYSQLKPQPGDPEFLRFSFRTPYGDDYKSQIPCHLTETTEETHRIILSNLDRSPMYTHVIKGVGPRYCPSIEDKVVRFKDKPSHHIFIEPEDRHFSSIYPQGLNTSLPEDVQDAFLRSMPGLRDVTIIRFGYAVEYDFVFPDQLKPSLETQKIKGLFLAGQINGTSGYEEAAGQGIVAGINAGLYAQNRPPFILTRENSFIGTMIDDLITKNIYEPYRMLTSRSEYRILLRQDNAIFRLSELAYDTGLLSHDDILSVREAADQVAFVRKFWAKTSTSEALKERFSLNQKIKLIDFMKRPEIGVQDLDSPALPEGIPKEALDRAHVMIKYEGYLSKQEEDIAKIQKFEQKEIPPTINYRLVMGLRNESREKLIQYAPRSIFEAKKIAGINPADLMVLIGYLERSHSVKAESL